MAVPHRPSVPVGGKVVTTSHHNLSDSVLESGDFLWYTGFNPGVGASKQPQAQADNFYQEQTLPTENKGTRDNLSITSR